MTDSPDRLDARAEALVQSTQKLLADLIAMRKKHRLTQEEVADRMGVSQPTVAAFERYDSNPTQTSIQRYAMAVGARVTVSVDDDCEDHTSTDERFVGIVGGSVTGRAGAWRPSLFTRFESVSATLPGRRVHAG